MNVTIYVVMAAAIPAVVILGALIWAHVQQQAAIDRLDDRVAHLMAGTSLLTDTIEGALRDVAVEVGRLAAVTEGARPRSGAAGQRRIAGAAKRGHSVRDIAANEQMSEGEVRLHLQLNKSRKERAHHASMR
jgi:DNA-binding NarL/FixJ family response regulator